MMSLAAQWAERPAGLVAWLAIVGLVVGVGLLMRYFAVNGPLPRLRQTALIVAVTTSLLIIAGVGGFALLQGATAGG
jgi:hypothetical protein